MGRKKESQFNQLASVYDLIYEDKDSSQEVLWILAELDSRGLPTPANILELGSGTGRHAQLMADHGHMVTGVEPSPEMLARTGEHSRTKFVAGDARDVRLDKKFDAVLALFHVVSYQNTSSDISDFFATAASHLNPGGLLGFDIWYSPAVHAQGPEARTLIKEDHAIKLERVASPTEELNHSLVTVNYRFSVTDKISGKNRVFTEEHKMRHFCETEIELYSSMHGFELLEGKEFLTGRQPSRDTWGVWFTLRKA